MVIYIKQHVSNIWSSIHEKVKSNTEAELKKKALLIKKVCIFTKQTPSKLFDRVVNTPPCVSIFLLVTGHVLLHVSNLKT